MSLRASTITVALISLLGLGACGGTKDDPPKGDPPKGDPAKAEPGPAPALADAAAAALTAIERLCQRDEACGCPIADCPAFFAKVGLPDEVFACFAEQTCEALCEPGSGAPGSTLHAACLQGVDVPAAAPSGGGRTSCRTDNDCAGNHDCCDGRCYAMGTSLWQTHCMMPSGKF